MAAPAASGQQGRRFLESAWAKGAVGIAGVEALLVAVGVIPKWVAVGIAAAIIAAWFWRLRRLSRPATRRGIWAITMSQGLVLFVPIALWIIGTTVVLVFLIAAVGVLVLLLRDR